MTREDVLGILRAHEAELRKQKGVHAALFGSLARGEAGPDSDIDIMVEIEDLFPIRVDVAQRAALKPHVKPLAERDAIYAF